MKVTGNLKKQAEAASSKAETREVMAKSGIVLTDDKQEKISGGAGKQDAPYGSTFDPRGLRPSNDEDDKTCPACGSPITPEAIQNRCCQCCGSPLNSFTIAIR